MASGITTAQQLVDILDAIYNNVEQYDTYTGADGTLKGSLRLYYNEITKTATIFKRHLSPLDPLEPSYDYVVCTFNPENVVTANDETFLCKVMKNVAAGAVTYANDIALGAYVGVKTLLRNICAALGVNMATNFDELQPQLYEDMLNIIKKYYGSELENNAPYGLARKDIEEGGTTTTTYRSYIPVMIIVEIAIYLNNLGLFNVGGDALYQPIEYPVYNSITDYDSISEYYDFMNKSDYKTFLEGFSNIILQSQSAQAIFLELAPLAIKALFDTYGPEIDLDTNIATAYLSTVSATPYKGYKVDMYLVPKTCKIKGNLYNGISTSFTCYNDTNFTKYSFSMEIRRDSTTLEDTYINNKTVTECNAEQEYTIGGGVKNFKCNKYIKPYYRRTNSMPNRFATGSSTSSLPYYFVDSFADLVPNTLYEISNINLLSSLDVMRIIGDTNIATAIKQNNITFDKNTFCGIKLSRNNTSDIYVCNPTTVTYSGNARVKTQIANTYGTICKSTTVDNYIIYRKPYLPSATTGTCTVTFNTTIPITVYHLSYDTSTNPVTITVTTETINDNKIQTDYTLVTNIGELITIEPEGSFDGLTLQEGATYPTSVIDLNSFNATYPNWEKIGYSQPYFVDDELENTYTAQWATISVDKTPPTNQQDGQDGEVDPTDTSQIEDIIDDIDDAEEGNDDEETDPNDNTNDSDDGDTPQEDNVGDLPSALGGGFIKQYMLTESEMQAFATQLITPNFWTSVNMFLSDPMDAVISLQAGYLFNTQGATSQQLVFNGYTFSNCTGTLLQTNYLDIDLGTINIGEKFQNYQDITNTQLEIFLPYIGYVNLEIGDFLNGAIHLRARIDTLTGTIVYSIYSERDGAKQLTHQISGNCQVQLPIKSEDHSSLLRSLIHSNKIGG